MSMVVISTFVSLDGVMEDPGGGEGFKQGGWQLPFGDLLIQGSGELAQTLLRRGLIEWRPHDPTATGRHQDDQRGRGPPQLPASGRPIGLRGPSRAEVAVVPGWATPSPGSQALHPHPRPYGRPKSIAWPSRRLRRHLAL
jgi:hypothetical protein